MNVQKKSQAALEFLTTYAWAFIVILILIAAIAYFGILRPQRILPDRCNFNVGFDCQAYSFDRTGTLNLRLKNGIGHVVDLTGISLLTEAQVFFGCSLSSPILPLVGWGIGAVQDFTFTGCDMASQGFGAGEKAKVLVNMSYYDPKAGATFRKVAEGEIFTAVT